MVIFWWLKKIVRSLKVIKCLVTKLCQGYETGEKIFVALSRGTSVQVVGFPASHCSPVIFSSHEDTHTENTCQFLKLCENQIISKNSGIIFYHKVYIFLKVSEYGDFLVCIFPYSPVFGLNTENYRENLRIQSIYGKIRTRKTPNTDTFHALLLTRKCQKVWQFFHCGLINSFMTEFSII